MTDLALYLASASPRRSELLRQIGVPHEIRPVSVDETPLPEEDATRYVSRLAKCKAEALWMQLGDAERAPVLAADTAVVLDGVIFGKPEGHDEALRMLRSLSGRTHQVHTAVALFRERGLDVRISSSDVTFRPLDETEIQWYWLTGEPAGKAGGYAVQGRAAVFISRIEGSYSGVMGLPLYETWQLLSNVMRLGEVAA
jgi:septum formation protein